MVILAANITGDISKLALFSHQQDTEKGKFKLGDEIKSQEFNTKDYADAIENIIQVFLQENYDGKEDIYGACFSIAGPVDSAKAEISRPNFKSIITVKGCKEKLPYKNLPFSMINDMEALGFGLFLGDAEESLEEIYKGNQQAEKNARRVLMLVSGGLGQAVWHFCDNKNVLQPLSSEGGHSDFAAQTDEEIILLKALQARKREVGDNTPVSYEYVLSHPGLIRIYEVFANLVEGQSDKDANTIISGATQGDPLCKKVLDLFLSAWGRQAGNLALTYMGQGGIYVGGISIPTEIFKESGFIEAFLNKEGNFRKYNEAISIKKFEEADLALLGAARHAIEEGYVTKGKFAILRSNQDLLTE